MMKRKEIGILFLLLFAGPAINAQIITIHLTASKKLHHIRKLPFNHVVVLDDRFDSTKIATKGDGIHPVIIWKLDSPASSAIKTYVETTIGKFPRENRLLFISVKQLRYQNLNPMAMFFSADAYFQKKDSFLKVATVQRSYSFYNSSHSTEKRIAEAFNDLIEEVNKNYHDQNKIYKKAHTYQNITTNIEEEWMNYPILQPDLLLGNGIYGSVEDLKYNTVKPVDLSLKMESDSAYTISFHDAKDMKKWEGLYDVYAICYNDRLYVKIMGKYFLPLSKANGILYLHVPLSLPNMYAIVAASTLRTGNDPLDPSNVSNIYGLLLVIAVNSALRNKASVQYVNTKQEILDKGLISRDMRTCFLDMDTGDIIY